MKQLFKKQRSWNEDIVKTRLQAWQKGILKRIRNVTSPRSPAPSPRRVLGDGGTRWRGRAVCVDVFTVDVLGAGMEGVAVFAAGVALLESVEFDSWLMLVSAIVGLGFRCLFV